MYSTVSLTIIAQNEEPNLAACLSCVADLVQEIIVIDTGSSDRSREIARQFGAQVYDFPWCDNFAAVRNEALRHASSPWIFWMDADDRLDLPTQERLRALFASLGDENAAYLMRCVSPLNASGSSVTEHLRLFRNHPEIRWEHRVHEQIRDAVTRCGHEVRASDVVIRHVGYLDRPTLLRKAERNLRLLELQRCEQPDSAFVLFNMGRCYQVLGRMGDAVASWQASLDRISPDALFLRKLYALLVDGYGQLGHKQRALALSQHSRMRFPEDPELLFHEGTLRIELGDDRQGEACMLRILESADAGSVSDEEPYLRSKARHNLAVLYRRQGRLADAESQLQACLAEQPDYEIAWLGLGHIWLDQGKMDAAEEAARQLDAVPELTAHAQALRTRARNLKAATGG